jgi:hypothetical protein
MNLELSASRKLMCASARCCGSGSQQVSLYGQHMLKIAFVCGSFIASMIIGLANAEQPATAALGIAQASQQKVQMPGTGYEFVLGSFIFPADGYVERSPLDRYDSADRLLTSLVTWISENFDIAVDYRYPRIMPSSSVAMTNLLYRRQLEGRLTEMSIFTNEGQLDQRRGAVALYDYRKKTIYLHSGWTGRTQADLSILVREMIHHFQNLAQITYTCFQEREKLPYQAQEKWLNLFGLSLLSEFGLDRTTIAEATVCTNRDN